MQYRDEKTGTQKELIPIVDALLLPGGHIDILLRSRRKSTVLIVDEACGQG
jgi:hypothetical protein